MGSECEVVQLPTANRTAFITQSAQFPLLRAWRLATHSFPKFNHHRYNDVESDETTRRNALQRLKQAVQNCRKYDKRSDSAVQSQPQNVANTSEKKTVWRHFPLKHNKRDCFPIRRSEHLVQLMAPKTAKNAPTCVRNLQRNNLKARFSNVEQPIKQFQTMFPVKTLATTKTFPSSTMATAEAPEDVHLALEALKTAVTNMWSVLSPTALNYSPLSSTVSQKFPSLNRTHDSKRFPYILCEKTEEISCALPKLNEYSAFLTNTLNIENKFPIICLKHELHKQFPMKPILINKNETVKITPCTKVAVLNPANVWRAKYFTTNPTIDQSKACFTFPSNFPILKCTHNANHFPLLTMWTDALHEKTEKICFELSKLNEYSALLANTLNIENKFPITCLKHQLHKQFPMKPILTNNNGTVKVTPYTKVVTINPTDVWRSTYFATNSSIDQSKAGFIFSSNFPILKCPHNANHFPLLKISTKAANEDTDHFNVSTQEFVNKRRFPINHDLREMHEQHAEKTVSELSTQLFEFERRFPFKRETREIFEQRPEKSIYSTIFLNFTLQSSNPSLKTDIDMQNSSSQLINKWLDATQVLNSTLQFSNKSSKSSENVENNSSTEVISSDWQFSNKFTNVAHTSLETMTMAKFKPNTELTLISAPNLLKPYSMWRSYNFSVALKVNSAAAVQHFPLTTKSTQTSSTNFPFIEYLNALSQNQFFCHSDHKWQNSTFLYANNENENKLSENNNNDVSENNNNNHIIYNNVSSCPPAQTMTQSGIFSNKQPEGGYSSAAQPTIERINSETQTNLARKREKQEQEQQQQRQCQYTSTNEQHKRNDNDVVLSPTATTTSETAKNNLRATAQQNYSVEGVVRGPQNSRSANLLCSEENMNDVQQQYEHARKETITSNVKSGNVIAIIRAERSSPKSNDFDDADEERMKERISHALMSLKNVKNIKLNVDVEQQQQQPSTPSPVTTCSDVCGTSSQADLPRGVVECTIACESCIVNNNNGQRSSAITTTSSSSSSPLTARVAEKTHVSSTSVAAGLEARVTQHEQQSLINETQFPYVTRATTTHTDIVDVLQVTDDPQHSKNRVHTAMTLTKVEDQCDEENLSVSSSTYVDDNQSKQTNVDECIDAAMKYEMKSATKSTVTNPITITPLRPNLLQQTKSETRLNAHLGSGAGSTSSSSLLAATDLSRLANFGKPRPRREGSGDAVIRSVSSDAQDSVLPARTLLRRQRRLQTQYSEDKKEDPIERLNRLRARISSTLSEVKGVLQHYSVDEGGETNARCATQLPTVPTMGNAARKYDAQPTSATQQSTAPTLGNAARKYDVQPLPKPIEDKPKEEGPVNFRFVRKVRRRSVFSEDKKDEEQPQEIQSLIAEKKEREEKATGISESPTKDETDHVSRIEEETELIAPILNKKVIEKDNTTNKQIENSTALEQANKKIAIEAKTNKARDNLEITQNEENTQVNRITEKESGKLDTKIIERHEIHTLEKLKSTDVETKSTKNQATKRLLIKQKSDERRASIAAPEVSKIVPPIDTETPQLIKTQRRPSDSEAMLKRRNFRAQINTTNFIETQACQTDQVEVTSKAIKQNMQIKSNEAKETSMRSVGEFTASTNALAIVKEEKSSVESATETATKIGEIQPQIETAIAAADAIVQATQSNATETATKKSKKRLTLKAKEPTIARRASVAAAEVSQIEPPVKATTAFDVKSQRRPSDSEAVVKRKATTSEADDVNTNVDVNANVNRTATTKVRTITKVKRPSVKSNVSSADKQPSTTTCGGAAYVLSGVANNSHKDAAQSLIALPTQSSVITNAITIEIDDANKQIPVNETINTTKVTTNDFQSATKLDGQPDAMVATLSPLRATEASRSIDRISATNVTVNTKQLLELVNENILETHAVSKTFKSETSTPTATAKETELPKHNTSAAESIQQRNASASEKLINQATAKTTPQAKAPPADILQAALVQQVSYSEAPSQQTESSLRETNKIDDNSVPTTTVSAIARETTKSDNAANDDNSLRTSIAATATIPEPETKLQTGTTGVTTATGQATAIVPNTQFSDIMPELQVVPAPVKPLQVYAENEAPKDALINQTYIASKEGVTKKKIIIKKVRKNSIEKAYERKLSTSASQEKTETTEELPIAIDADSLHNEAAIGDTNATISAEATNEEETPATPAPPKKARQVKKKVIIRRQQRKLSISDAFFQVPTQPEKQTTEVETLEKPIAYVTDDEEGEAENVVEPVKPLKTCIKQREYQVGDWVMYGERFRKTQIRWKKGRITERITSISYKIDIDGQEVSAHISYIKKYTGRKVNFGGKEYLEIDYEQIAEEERRARTYSIWNMV